MTPGFNTGGANQLWIGVDEADDLDAQLAPPLEQFARERHGGRAGADDEQSLAGRGVARQPIECHAPSDDQADDHAAGPQEHAAADDQRRKPVIDQREDDRRRAERLEQAHEHVAPIAGDAQVVQIAVVQAELTDTGDQQRLGEAAVLEEK